MSVDWDSLVIGPLMTVFGDVITYQPSTGPAQAINGVFDEEYLALAPLGRGPFTSTESMEFGAPGTITSSRPVLGVKLSQFLTLPQQGDTLFGPDGTQFMVKEVQADGHGSAKLLLNALSTI